MSPLFDINKVWRPIAPLSACLLWLAAAAACHGGSRPGPSSPEPMLRLDTAIGAPMTPAEYDSLRAGLEAWRMLDRLSSQSAIAMDDSVLSGMASSEIYRVFAPDVRRLFTAQAEVESRLGEVRDRMDGFGYTVCGIVSPFGTGVVTVDSVMLVALNHYLGPDYPGYEGFAESVRRLKEPGRIAYDAAEAALSALHPYDRGGELSDRLLSRMAYDGALALAVLDAVPGADDASAMGWTDAELERARAGVRGWWNEMLRHDMLFSTDPMDARRMLDLPANTAVLGPDVPGRPGRYMGMLIGRAWLDSHPGATVSDLLEPDYYLSPTLLQDSGYSGR